MAQKSNLCGQTKNDRNSAIQYGSTQPLHIIMKNADCTFEICNMCPVDCTLKIVVYIPL